jgi:hypothetical protein
MISIYEVSATLANSFMDGRNTASVWGHERQFHPTRAEAEAACDRLQHAQWGRVHPPHYEVLERTRDQFPTDIFGEEEWRRACHQAGIDPAIEPPDRPLQESATEHLTY